MSPRKYILILIFGFFIGIFTASFLNLDYYFGLFLALFGLIFLFPQFLKIGDKNFYITVSMLLIGISLGVLRYEVKDAHGAALDSFINQKMTFEALTINEPQKTENYIKVVVKTSKIVNSPNPAYAGFGEQEKTEQTQNQKILVYSRLYPEFHYGDKILITGKIQKPKKFSFGSEFSETNSNKQFDWPAYLAKNNIYYQMFYPEIKFISPDNGSFIKQKLFTLKNRFTENLEKIIPAPASSFMAGVTVGEKSALPKTLKDDLIKTGTIHLVVLSGYNITIIAASVISILKMMYLPNMIVSAFGILTVSLFTIMAGAEAATVRAAIMAVLMIAANGIGRMYAAMYALIFAAFFMILQNPMILRFDSSFQLSFLATFGLVYFTPYFKNKLKSAPEFFKLKENFITTLSAQIAVLPLLIYNTGSFSLFSLPLNILILSFIPTTMFFGFLTGIFGFLSFYLSHFFGLISYVFLAYEIWLINFFGNLPFSYINLSPF